MEIQDIKSRLSIGEVLNHYGLQPNKNKMLCCPFHADKTPSMQVYPETGTVHCFSGNCMHTGKAIDQIDFIMLKEQLTKHEAINKAKKLIGETIITKVNEKHRPMNLSETFIKLQQALPRSKKAVEYLESRGIHDAKLEMGYNNGTSFNSLKNCIVFPLKDHQDNIVSLYGRSIPTSRDKLSNDKEQRHFYLKDRKGLYPHYPHGMATFIVLTESIIDAATLKKYTDYQVLALYGTNGLTEEHIRVLKALMELREIILFFDGDEAGEKAAEKYGKELSQLLPNTKISKVATPEGEDPNSLVQSHEPTILNHLIETRTMLFSSSETPSNEEEKQPDIPSNVENKDENPAVQALQCNVSLNTKNPDYLTFTKAPLLISVMGGIGLHPIDKMRVTLKIERTDSRSPLHSLRHSLDLYHDDQTEKLVRKTAERLELGSREVQITMAELIQALEDHRAKLIEQQKPKKPEKREITPEREKRAISIMKRPNYQRDILYELIQKTGVVGERKNSLILWQAYATRKQKDPLHVICLGASGTGKTFLQERITDLIPEEDKVSGTAISENALYYAQDLNLSHKLFIIEDLDGASNILYALRELQTKKTISKMVTQKDSKGNMRTEIVTVHGPICLTATTTKERLYEDNANRCLLIYLDGSKEQQEAIMDDQRKRSAGKVNRKEQEEAKELLRDMQALYRPVAIRNPYAELLKIPETVFKPLRTNSHYLAFIEGITFCNQFQRKTHQDPETGELYIHTEIEDIALANELMKDVLLSKSDELTKACRDFYESVKRHLSKENKTSFYKNEVRDWIRINPNNLKYYLRQLALYGYLKIVNQQKRQGFEYEISDREEYERLNQSLQTAMETALVNIKNQGNG